MVGQTLSHYRIVERIGEGGMGVVYRARDERLDRDVALKVLSSDLLSDEAAGKRFRLEARALSRLNHPNVAAVYDFDSQQGVSFIAMEYAAGRSLGEIARAAPLPEGDVLALAIQIAEGLAAAHREGVVHRDLKPGNMRLATDGRLKILDFGLAKLSAPTSEFAATESVLRTEGIVGTLPYMAPEQLRGATVDARTDLYSAGVVLYELATGRRPFAEPLTPALTDAILHAPPVAPGRLRPELSPALEGVILKCLEKDQAFRYQSAGDLLADLKRLAARPSAMALPARVMPVRRRVALRWVLLAAPGAVLAVLTVAVGLNLLGARDRIFGGASGQQIESLAVLPLDNFSRDPAQDAFVTGMTEALTAAVSQIPTLRVIGRTSAMQFAGTKQPIPEIARALGVDAVVEGSVLRDGSRVRITAQLVGVRPERHLWANKFDREMKDVLAIHSEVAQAIAREIRATLTPDAQARLASSRPVNPAAYEAYLRGRSFFASPVPKGLATAEAAFNDAIALDPGFAPAYASLGYAQLVRAILSGGPPRPAASNARVAAAKALELDPAQPEALAVEGTLNLYFDWDWAAAERRLKRALELNPSESLLYHPYADCLLIMGRLEESLEYTRRGAALEPLSPGVNAVVGGHLTFLRRYDEADALLRAQLERHPDLPLLHNMLGGILWLKGDYRAALDEMFRTPGPMRDAAMSGFAAAGAPGAARAVARALAARSVSAYVNPLSVAEWYVRAGDVERAFEWLQTGYEERSPFLLHLKANADFDPLRSDPRFAALLKRIGFPE